MKHNTKATAVTKFQAFPLFPRLMACPSAHKTEQFKLPWQTTTKPRTIYLSSSAGVSTLLHDSIKLRAGDTQACLATGKTAYQIAFPRSHQSYKDESYQ